MDKPVIVTTADDTMRQVSTGEMQRSRSDRFYMGESFLRLYWTLGVVEGCPRTPYSIYNEPDGSWQPEAFPVNTRAELIEYDPDLYKPRVGIFSYTRYKNEFIAIHEGGHGLDSFLPRYANDFLA